MRESLRKGSRAFTSTARYGLFKLVRIRRVRAGFGPFLHRLLLCSVLASLVLLGAGKGGARAESTPQKELLGLYLFNFLLFVDWPEGSFRTPHTLEVGLLAGEEGQEGLLRGIAGKQVRGRTLVIKRIRRVEEFDCKCQALFVWEASTGEIQDLVARAKHAPCLTMSAIPGFADLGGMVEFLPKRSHRGPGPGKRSIKPPSRFRINLRAVLQSNLKIRSRLLRLSDIVDQGGRP